MEGRSVPINPIVNQLLEQNATGIVEVKGYPGPGDVESVRIYSNLCLDKYIEIPQDAVLYFSESENPQDACRILFKSTTKVKYVSNVLMSASASASITKSFTISPDEAMRIAKRCSCSTTSTDKTATAMYSMLPPLDCQMQCEQKYKACERGLFCVFDYMSCRDECGFGGGGGPDGGGGRGYIPGGV